VIDDRICDGALFGSVTEGDVGCILAVFQEGSRGV